MQQDGFAVVPRAVLAKAPEIGVVALAVYCVLAAHANRNGECWPSQEAIATILGRNTRTVRTALKRLQDAGLIDVRLRRRSTPIYTLQGWQDIATQDSQGRQGIATQEPRVAKNGRQGWQFSASKGGKILPTERTEENDKQELPDPIGVGEAAPSNGSAAKRRKLNRTDAWKALQAVDFGVGNGKPAMPSRRKLDACYRAAVGVGVLHDAHEVYVQFLATVHHVANGGAREPVKALVHRVAEGKLHWGEDDAFRWAKSQLAKLNGRQPDRGGGPVGLGDVMEEVVR